MRRRLAAAVVAGACAVLFLQMSVLSRTQLLLGDFHAFYCGGSVIVHGRDPYAAQPLAACESAPQPYGLHRTKPGFAVPVPFPGYAFIAFALVSLLAFVPSALVWLALSFVAMGLTCVLLARMAGRDAAGVFAVFALGYCMAVWPYGELESFVLLSLVFAATCVRAGRMLSAAGALAVAALLPHVAAPAFIALFLCDRRSRAPLIGAVSFLAVAGIVTIGPVAAVQYFTRVLPAHTQSEIGSITQYGLTWLLHAAGVPDRTAIAAGEASYVAMAIAGVWLAGRLARRYAEPAFLVTVPCAFAVIGGSFVHYAEITLALPAIMLLWAKGDERLRRLSAIALVLVALPWRWALQPAWIVFFAASAFSIVVLFLRRSVTDAMRASLATLCLCTALVVAGALFGPAPSAGRAPHIDPALAQSSWDAYVRSTLSSSGIAWLATKIPTWCGLLLLALCCAYGAANEDVVARVAIEESPAVL